MEILYRAMHQPPSPDGVRRSKWAVVRNSYTELRTTTIKTMHEWIPPRIFGNYVETKHEYRITNIPMSDGTTVECEILYVPLDDDQDVSRLLSLDLTGAWLNEVREIPKIIFDNIDARCGRYPPKKDVGPYWYGVIADTNPPDEHHWLVKLEEEIHTNPEVAKKYAIYRQPSGVSPEAENIPNLRDNYYQDIMVGKDPEWVNVYVHGKNGFLRDGKPVYGNFSDQLHTSKTIIQPVKGQSLILGFDFGLNATCVIAQYLNTGRLNILEEFVGEDIAIRRLVMEVVRPVLNTKYRGYSLMITADPAGNKRSDTDEKSCFTELRSLGLRITHPAPSNSWMPRFMAVDSFLTRTIANGEPALQVSPNCELIRRGFISRYRRKKVGVIGSNMFREQAEKSIESHPHDCIQYIAMVCENTNRLVERAERARTTVVQTRKPSMKAWV